jgi:hypothetical protein
MSSTNSFKPDRPCPPGGHYFGCSCWADPEDLQTILEYATELATARGFLALSPAEVDARCKRMKEEGRNRWSMEDFMFAYCMKSGAIKHPQNDVPEK